MHGSLYEHLNIIFMYNSSILFRIDCVLPKTIVGRGGGFVVRRLNRALTSP